MDGLGLWQILFGRYEPTWTWHEIYDSIMQYQQQRKEYAIYKIKQQPFYTGKTK